MGVIKRGILGGFSGKVAGVVGSSWKGIAVMKALPLSVANPKTAGQVAQRTKFSAVVARAVFLLVNVVKPLWDRFAQQESGYNAFVSANIDAYDSSGDLTAADLVISQGKLTAPAGLAVSGTNGDPDVTATWTDNSGDGTALATDEAYFVVWNQTQDEWAIADSGTTRADSAILVSMPSEVATSDVLSGWLAFRRADGTIVSNTAYDTDTV